jgi:hypothetical protein
MSIPGAEMRWTSRTHATYTADWALFIDWCDAVDNEPLPADPTTVLEFLADCPAAAATQRRRVIAIDHHHTADGHPPPGADPGVRDALGRPPTELPPIKQRTLARVDAALRMLPSRGWTGGLFGRRDRCLLVLSQLARVPHRHLAGLVAGDITVANGAATVTVGDQTRAVVAVDDPVLCGPCAIARWLRAHQVIVDPGSATRTIARLLDKAAEPTSNSPHICRKPLPTADRATSSAPLLAPIDQWGATPFPMSPMSPHAVSRQARDLMDGTTTVHRDLPVHPVADEPAPTGAHRGAVVAAGYSKQQVRAAWDQRRSDLAELAGVADELADVDRRAAEINERIDQLLTMATTP